MSDQDTYEPAPKKSQMDQLDPKHEAVLREAKLVYDDILGPEEEKGDDSETWAPFPYNF